MNSSAIHPFLSLVARDLYQHYGNDLSRVAVVFPNKRAGLFFNEYLAACSTTPIWAPSYLTISELMMQHSPLLTADSIQMVCLLYRIFREETGSEETLDDFYFWGELLISDFDDLDKNLVDAERLFSNLNDLKNLMGDLDYLTEEQEEAIRLFFRNFSIEKRTELKEKFVSLWGVLGRIYHRFHEQLDAQGMGYEGMVYRHAIEHLQPAEMEYDCYAFVGFNVLNKVEHTLFSQLHEAGKARFYWDYDLFYTQNTHHEAGEFIRRNLRDFPSALNPESSPLIDAALFDNLRKPKTVRCISATSQNAQARYMAEWTADCSEGNERENAVVLCDESLLLPVYHALSPELQHVNVTMGFPLKQTPVIGFLQALLELQLSGYDQESGCFGLTQVLKVLRHVYFRQLSPQGSALSADLQRELRLFLRPGELHKDEFATLVFTPQPNHVALMQYLLEIIRRAAQLYQVPEQPDLFTPFRPVAIQEDFFNQLYQESLFKAYTTLQRFEELIASGELVVNNNTLSILLTRLLATLSVPFHGEPAIGLQVMGVLETRNLDFRRIALLSLEEGKLPQTTNTASFIPYNLRRAFGMTMVEHKNAVYAYYFYRLLQRAEDITLLYNNFADGLQAHEWSRFLIQFLVEWPHPVHRYVLNASHNLPAVRPISVVKEGTVYKKMLQSYDTRYRKGAYLSASALNCYLDCPLKFYLKYVAGLTPGEEVELDVNAALFGTIFHRATEDLYALFTSDGQKTITREKIQTVLQSKTTLELLLTKVFNELLFHLRPGEQAQYNGLQHIYRQVILRYVRKLLQHDLQRAPFTFVAAEEKIRESLTIRLDSGEEIALCVGGTIDRLDKKEDELRVVDYKTGGTPQTATDLESLFLPAEKRPGYIFQTFLYSSLIVHKERVQGQASRVVPCLLYIHKAASGNYTPFIRLQKQEVTDFAEYEEEFTQLLHTLLREIFDPAVSFTQTPFVSKCEYFDFKSLCRK